MGIKALAAVLAPALGLVLLLLAGVPPQAAATKTTTVSPPSQRNDLALMFPPSDVLFPNAQTMSDSTTSPTRFGDAVPMTGFRQLTRISVILRCYRHAPWEREGRSHAPPAGHSIFSCSSSSRARTV